MYNALVQLRRRSVGEYWIDAICINQSDLAERASQVQLMGRIYREAESVVVWLGQMSKLSEMSIAVFAGSTDRASMPPAEYWNCREDQIISTGTTAGIPAKYYRFAILGAATVTWSQWFIRTWVVQELCWAKQVVYLIGETEISVDSIVKSFEVAEEFVRSLDHSFENLMSSILGPPLADGKDEHGKFRFLRNWGSKFGPVWMPQIFYETFESSLKLSIAPMMLQAREHFQQGRMWTLLEWMLACRGRSATDIRDLVFAGLSLVDPKGLLIDTDILLEESKSMTTKPVPVLTRNKYDPQTIPPFGVKAIDRSFYQRKPTSSIKSPSLIPNGLWSALRADYTSGTRELLSIAARTSRPSAYDSDWWISTSDHSFHGDLPSWAPVPGSWTSHVNELLVAQKNSDFHAGGASRQPPKIAHDGRILYLDVEIGDQVEGFIIDDDFIDTFAPQQLRNLFVTLLNHSTMHGKQVSAINALSRVLLGGQEQHYPQLYQHAPSWLCHTLASAVFIQLQLERQKQYENSPRRCDYKSMTSDSFADLSINYHEQRNKTMEDLLNLFEEVLVTFSDQPWPEWSKTSRKFDMDIHVEFLHEMSEARQLDAQTTGAQTSTRFERATNELHDGMQFMERYMKYMESPEFPSLPPYTPSTKHKLQSRLFEPQDPDVHTHLTKLARSALAWRKVFFTIGGRIGYGPKWLVGGEPVLLVCGADIPYAFTLLEVDRRSRARQLRLELDENDQRYYEIKMKLQTARKPSIWEPFDALWYGRQQEKLKRLDERRLELQDKYDQILNSVPNSNGFVLQGEVYIDGIMHGEDLGVGIKARLPIV
ncbi:hypothetical protein GT037_005574 [Alternaria burnsii]|uniref:Heterokaryon incompatibility domain-containing protein n=1 Tax=Alternaria burnsii TaxID=1187904 RepID=A0A8H7EDS6_9PLEO|nr:uncharacterized protein GT037_005574 [Alternaria burnsii]KAF7676069.1 hypothetical protein GT037_005574 [Alternaria burnsii]